MVASSIYVEPILQVWVNLLQQDTSQSSKSLFYNYFLDSLLHCINKTSSRSTKPLELRLINFIDLNKKLHKLIEVVRGKVGGWSLGKKGQARASVVTTLIATAKTSCNGSALQSGKPCTKDGV